MWWKRLRAWWSRWRRPLGPWRVVVYTRGGCHLCEVAWNFLSAERRRYGFALAAVDVDTDPELARLYGECVPVVSVDGRVRFRGAVNPVLWKRLVRAELARQGRKIV